MPAFTWIFALVLFAFQSAEAQEPTRQSIEIAAVGRQTANDVTYTYGPPSGPTRNVREQLFGGGLASYSFALTPTLALEASGGYLFGHQIQIQQDGGEQILAHAGLRVTVPLGQSRYAFRARVAPGVSSFSSAVRFNDLTSFIDSSGVGETTAIPHYGRITHFSLEEGVGISTRLSAHTFFNFDASHETMVDGDRMQKVPLFSDFTGEKAYIEDHVLVTIGISRSFGRGFQPAQNLHSERNSASLPQTELVLSYALQPTVHLEYGDLGLDSGVAVTGSHFLRSWLALDSSVILLRGGDVPNFQDGGSELQFFAGIKAGLQRPRYGIFFKARPGLISFSNTYNPSYGFPPPPAIADDLGGDVGAVLELYPARHLMLRLDLGETVIRYSAISAVDQVSSYQPAFTGTAAQFLIGTGWRF